MERNGEKGESRLDLLQRNVAIMASVIDSMRPLRADGILLVVANPVDVLTRFAQGYSGLPVDQVIGSGTLLDSVRLRGMLAEEIDVCFLPLSAKRSWRLLTVGRCRRVRLTPTCWASMAIRNS